VTVFLEGRIRVLFARLGDDLGRALVDLPQSPGEKTGWLRAVLRV